MDGREVAGKLILTFKDPYTTFLGKILWSPTSHKDYGCGRHKCTFGTQKSPKMPQLWLVSGQCLPKTQTRQTRRTLNWIQLFRYLANKLFKLNYWISKCRKASPWQVYSNASSNCSLSFDPISLIVVEIKVVRLRWKLTNKNSRLEFF